MKSKIILFFLIVSSIPLLGQKIKVTNLTTFDDDKLHFGFTLGLNMLDFGVRHYPSLYDNPEFVFDEIDSKKQAEIEAVNGIVRTDVVNLSPGFTVGIVSSLRLKENIDLRFLPGLTFGNRKLVYNVPIHDLTGDPNETRYYVRSTYIDFPFMIKYKAKRMSNNRPYLVGGPTFRYDIAKPSDSDLIQLTDPSFYLEIGMGWDTYFQFFRFSTELKIGFGLNNSLGNAPKYPQPTYYNLAIKKLTSNVITLSFHFE